MSEYLVKVQLPDADYSLAKITAEVGQIILEVELPIDQTQGQEGSAGGSLQAVCRKRTCGTCSDRSDEDDQGETWFSDSLPPRGIRSSRKRLKKKKRQSPARKNVKRAEVEEEPLMLENENQAEVAQEENTETLIPTPVRIVIFAIFVFVIFMHIINGG